MASLPPGDKDNGGPSKLPNSGPNEKGDSDLPSDNGVGDERKKRRYGLICPSHANREPAPAAPGAHPCETRAPATQGAYCTDRDCSFHPFDGNKPAWAQEEIAWEEWVRQHTAVSSAQAQPDNAEPEKGEDEEAQSDKEQ
ncbi:hypothetical protein N7466_001788 [Penicillium verhagenii]|uniref:uncharacterized protein n=1 Tax=Penicillium verhagenii TaxID=1562060 RepID=UPI002545930D|nr:uncharacterized protein N7466_001788 [Penicillium verhagenii]KAJ5938654.1 hypothetical protein N7466_001788 [Penicillium verhagenii]